MGLCRGGPAHWLVLTLLLSAAVALLTSACDGPPYTVRLELVNPTDVRLEVRVDGEPISSHAPWIEPGGTRQVADFRYAWERPRRVQAYDEQGKLYFERSLTDVDLDAVDWRLNLLPGGSP
jgi:hypothetical protein